MDAAASIPLSRTALRFGTNVIVAEREMAVIEIVQATIDNAGTLANLNQRVQALHVHEAAGAFVQPLQAELEE